MLSASISIRYKEIWIFGFYAFIVKFISTSNNYLARRHIGKIIQVLVSHEVTHWSKKVEVGVEVEVEVRVMACPQFRRKIFTSWSDDSSWQPDVWREYCPEFDVNNRNGRRWIDRCHPWWCLFDQMISWIGYLPYQFRDCRLMTPWLLV